MNQPFFSKQTIRLCLVIVIVVMIGITVAAFSVNRISPSPSIVHIIIVGGLIALAIAVIVGAFINRWFVTPVRNMQTAIAQMTDGDANRTVPITGQDEIAELGQTLKRMASTLQQKIQDLAGEREKVTTVLESMVEGVIALDHRRRILLLNSAARSILDLRQENVAGRSLLEVIRNRELADLVEACQVSDDKTPSRREVEVGPPFNRVLETHAIPLAIATEKAGILLVFHDITDLRRLEQIRTEFVANVSHELRTPLTAIKGYLETLLDEAPNEPATHRRFLEVVNIHAERLGRLVDDLLSLSDIETGKVVLKLSSVGLSELIHEISAIFEKDAAKKGVSFLNQVPPSLSVHADRDRLSQILVNLIDNAVKYTPQGGQILFTTASLPGNMVEVHVKDTGIGVPSTDLPRLTERFYRVDKARSRELGGTGLGLAIVKHLVHLHNGTLHIDSELDKGTTVRIAIPVG